MPWQTPAPWTGYYTPAPVVVSPYVSPADFFQKNPDEAAAQAKYNAEHPNKGTIVQQITAPVVKPVEKAIGQAKDIVKEVAKSPITQIALAYYMPGLVEAFAPSLTALGIEGAAAQTAVANAISSAAVQVAQGVPLDKALQTAVTNAAVSSGSAELTKQINTVISNPAVTKAIVSAGSSAAKTALNGGSQSDIEKNLVAGLLGSGASSATGSNIVGGTVAGGVTGGVTGALIGAASELGEKTRADEKAAKDKAAAADLTNKVSTLIGDELKQVGIAGALPAGDTGAYARALENSNQALIRLVKEAANDPAFLQKLPVLEDALVKAGTSISKVLGTGLSLGTYSTELNPNEQDMLQKRLKDAKIEITLSPLPLTDPNAGRVPVAPGVDLTKPGEITEPIIPTPVTPSPAPKPVNPDQPILDIINPPLIPKLDKPSPVATAPVSPTPPSTPAPPTVEPPAPKPIIPSPVAPPSSPTEPPAPKPVTPSPGVSPTAPQEPTTPEKPVVTPTPEPGVAPPKKVTTPEEPTADTELPPVEDKTGKPVPYDPRLYTSSVLSATLGANLPFYPRTGMTGGLTSTRGAGEIESKETGKARKNVWNEASLRLKDALGV